MDTNSAFTASSIICADTGATHHLFRKSDISTLIDIHHTSLTVQLPNGEHISAIGAGTLFIPQLPHPLLVYIFPDTDLKISLLSISQLCSIGCHATFTDQRIHITYNGITIIDNKKSVTDMLWHVHFAPIPQLACALTSTYISAPTRTSTDAAFVQLIHAAFGSPALSSFAHAVRANYFASITRLTSAMIAAHPPHSLSTALGHLDQIRQGQHSTKQQIVLFPEDIDDTSDLPADNTISDHTYTHVFQLSQTMHSDLTGKFPVTSFSGMQYILVSVLDGYGHVEPMKTRHHLEYIAAYKRTINYFSKLGRKPLFQRLDNETSVALENFARQKNISIQYCAPHQHRALKAERAIRTFKNHFIATLCTAATDFPLGLWDELLLQAELCLNHLLPYPPNPTVSSYAGLHGGPFNFAAHPIAPAGVKVITHTTNLLSEHHGPHTAPMATILGPLNIITVVIASGHRTRALFELRIPSHGFYKAFNCRPHQLMIFL